MRDIWIIMTETLHLKEWAIKNQLNYGAAHYLYSRGEIPNSFQDIESKCIFVGNEYDNNIIYCKHSKTKYWRSSFYEDFDIDYYILGAYITDGNISNNVAVLTSKDDDWLKNISSYIGENIPINNIKNRYYRLAIHSKELVKWFKENNCIENKTLSVEFPKNIPDQNVKDFIRGIIDGDGCIYLHKNIKYSSISIASASKKFAYSIQENLLKFGIKSNIIKRKPITPFILNGRLCQTKNPLYIITINGINCFYCLKWCYYDRHKISLKRKNDLAQIIIDHYNNLKNIDGRKIQKLGINSKIKWPNIETILSEIKKIGITKLSKKLGVSSKAISLHLSKRKISNLDFQKKPRINWPSHDELLNLVKNNDYGKVCLLLNVSRIQLRRHLRKNNIYKEYKNY